MRDLIFRGKRQYDGSWLFVNIRKCFESPTSASMMLEQETIGQYTDIKDWEGNEIYEGDIISFEIEEQKQDGTSDVVSHVGVVGFFIGEFGVDCSAMDRGDDSYYTFGQICDQNIDGEYMKVLGNVYDNPEMLKEGQGK